MLELPKKLPAKGLSVLFGVSEQRISQLKRKGILRSDSDNMYDVAEAMKARQLRATEHGARMVAQTYGNGTGIVSPPKVALTTAPVDLSPEDREALGLGAADTVGVEVSDLTPSPQSHFVQASRLTELREQKLKAEIERAETRAKKERGELVERAAVQSSFVAAGQLISNIMQNLPAEIAAIFADPDKRAEVRLKVQTRVDQAQHALYAALRDYGDENAG